MLLYILDTDHVSFLQRGNSQVLARLAQINLGNRAVTIVTMAEQLQGRLSVIRRARAETEAAQAFDQLRETVSFYDTVRVLPYSDSAVAHYERLRQQKIRVGTQDLRIAAITLSHEAVLVTRNRRDFERVPELAIEDWTI